MTAPNPIRERARRLAEDGDDLISRGHGYRMSAERTLAGMAEVAGSALHLSARALVALADAEEDARSREDDHK